MKLAWATDIHLNFLKSEGRKKFYQDMLTQEPDALLISGDIAEANSVASLLHEMAQHVAKPIYFVLGNHDYYRGMVSAVREAMTTLTAARTHLFWLPASGPQVLPNDTILLGQDGWADGRLGDYAFSNIELNDSHLIIDLFQAKILGKFQLLDKMQQLADIDAAALQNDLEDAIQQQPKKIIVLTHVPPFKEACMHNGRMSDIDWLPYFSSKATGDVLFSCAKANPAIDFLVLCGHTHSAGFYQPLNNLTVKAGKAEYFQPAVQEVIGV
jgi:predicted MPP superfamily phosphohydrolase